MLAEVQRQASAKLNCKINKNKEFRAIYIHLASPLWGIVNTKLRRMPYKKQILKVSPRPYKH